MYILNCKVVSGKRAQIVREDVEFTKTLKSVMASSIISASKESEARSIGNVRLRHGGSGGLGDGVDEIPSAARKQAMFVLATAAAAKAVAISMAAGARAESELAEAKRMEFKRGNKEAMAKVMELKYHQGKAYFSPPPFRPVPPRPPQSCRTSSTVAQCRTPWTVAQQKPLVAVATSSASTALGSVGLVAAAAVLANVNPIT